MCLAVPGKLIEIYEQNGLRMGKIDYAGTINSACIEYTPEATLGQYVIVHAGFAISVIEDSEAKEALALWQEMIENEQKGDKSGTPD
jgi:hydrogenase expression/formation protein HypC